MKEKKYIALDFDCTVVKDDFPRIGAPVPGALEWLRIFQDKGILIVLNTMRSDGGSRPPEATNCLTEAVNYLIDNGIKLYGINKNPDKSSWGSDSPKVNADIFIDDRAAGCPLIYEDGQKPYADWSKIGPETLKRLGLNEIKLSDYVIDWLISKDITTIFSVSGGFISHLLDSVNKKRDKINIVFCRHEQACAMAAEGYYKASGKIACVLVTNGPGASNLITGVVCAYQDSVPMIILSGNTPSNQSTSFSEIYTRQIGVQELEIIPIAKQITNEARTLYTPTDIKHILPFLYEVATKDRKGPVWLEIPLDFQSAKIDPENCPTHVSFSEGVWTDYDIQEIYSLVKSAKKPLIIAGAGIRGSNCINEFLLLVKSLQCPVISTWAANDLFDWNDPLYIGNFGILGQRAANLAVQNCDLLLVLGSRLSLPNTGYNYGDFAPKAKKIMVDIDGSELNKKTLKIDYKICIDLKKFIEDLDFACFTSNVVVTCDDWKSQIQEWKNKFPIPEYTKTESNKINCFTFLETLSKHLTGNEVIVTDMGSSFTASFQTLKLNGKTRMFTNFGCASMGYGLPAAIGAWFADKSKNVILIAGDGGFQMNIQELQTVKHYNIPLKIFILNNNGYSAISIMQDNIFNKEYIGSTDKDVSAPNFRDIAEAYKIESWRVCDLESLDYTLNRQFTILCEVMIQENQPLYPRVQSYKNKKGEICAGSLENMYPEVKNEQIQ